MKRGSIGGQSTAGWWILDTSGPGDRGGRGNGAGTSVALAHGQMRRPALAVAIAVGLQVACTTTHYIPRPANGPLGPLLMNEPGRVSLLYVDPSAPSGYEVKRRGLGGLEGAGLGTLAGALGGALMAMAGGDDPSCEDCFALTAEEKGVLGGVLGAIGGVAIGALVGALIGHTDRYVFTDDRDQP